MRVNGDGKRLCNKSQEVDERVGGSQHLEASVPVQLRPKIMVSEPYGKLSYGKGILTSNQLHYSKVLETQSLGGERTRKVTQMEVLDGSRRVI